MTENNTTPETQQIDLNDVAIMVSAVDIASKAGAFDGQVMATIGLARNRLHELIVEQQKRSAENQAGSNDLNSANGIQDNVGVTEEAEIIVEPDKKK